MTYDDLWDVYSPWHGSLQYVQLIYSDQEESNVHSLRQLYEGLLDTLMHDRIHLVLVSTLDFWVYVDEILHDLDDEIDVVHIEPIDDRIPSQ